MGDGSRSAKTQLLEAVKGWPEVMGLLADGANSLFPNAEATLNSETLVPFLAILEEDQANVDDIVESVSYGFWVYDLPEQSYWRINRVHRAIRKKMEEFNLGVTADGILSPFQFEFKSGDARDDDLDKLVKFARYRTWLVA